MKNYIIHLFRATERLEIVGKLQSVLKDVEIIDAVDDKETGCFQSHLRTYMLNEEELCIFEDDCEIVDEAFLDLLDQRHKYDIMYFGYNSLCNFANTGKTMSWGTHSMYVSARAKKCFIDYCSRKKIGATPIDWVWNWVEHHYNLRSYRPPEAEKYTRQKRGLVSYITNKVR